jgi:glycosyltransferase involved in cell wall biosynthesis
MTDDSKEKQPLVSVVTPFYNTDAYLAECIESVLAQTFQNWEYILVNNCSMDRSLAIAESYAEKDERIRIVNNPTFLSQVQNYNHALRQISKESKYCKMVQADDWIFPNCLAEMVALAEDNHSVGIVGAYSHLGNRVNLFGLPLSSKVFTGRSVCRSFLLDGIYVFGSPTELLIRSDLIRARDPFYGENSYFEDAELCFELLHTNDFGFVHQVLSFSRRDNTSIVSKWHAYNYFELFRFLAIKKYGTLYLTKSEFRKRLREIKRSYFLYLGESVLRIRDKQFWQFHKTGLQEINYHLHWFTLTTYAFLSLLILALNPKDTVERLARFI